MRNVLLLTVFVLQYEGKRKIRPEKKNLTKMKLYTMIGLSTSYVHWCVNKTGKGMFFSVEVDGHFQKDVKHI